ncbi:hypothetical protein H2509_17240 [Stappia sp. F7233]|uniref:Uncharacterized protein n=1 Tax=Stappia albiluteola TaxID=2758565 RepID=A0A839AIY0_9HYPH|nr:hypothetical protein [Stappia albiluteola]MBA5778874.1 hypothetical protein [Stappia albiluteola]
MAETQAEGPLAIAAGRSGLTSRYRAASGSDVLAVVYSQARVPDGKFGLERLFAITRHACLFLNAPDASWYRGFEAEIDERLDKAVAASRPARIIHYGSSKGAYGALLTGLRRGDGEILAFGPEFELGLPGSRSAEAGVASVGGVELLHGIESFDGPLRIVFGAFDPFDAAGAAAIMRLANRPAGLRVSLLSSSHASHDHLYSLNIIRKVIARFDRDLDAECRKRGLAAAFDVDELAAFAGAGLRHYRGEAVDPAALEGLAERNPGAALLLADVLAGRGEILRALDRLARLQKRIDGDPALARLPKRWRKTVWFKRLALTYRSGPDTAAEALANEAVDRFPEDLRWRSRQEVEAAAFASGGGEEPA